MKRNALIGLLFVFIACLGIQTQAVDQNVPNVVFWGSQAPTVPPDLTNAVQLAMASTRPGVYYALLPDGTVYGSPLTGVAKICSLDERGLLALSGGSVYLWTADGVQLLPGMTNVMAIAAGYDRALALKVDGTVVGWGESSRPIPPFVTNVTAIAAKGSYNMALKGDGTIVAWGGGNNGLLTNVTSSATNFIAISMGAASIGESSTYYVGLKSDGTIESWGANHKGQRTGLDLLTDIKAIAAGPTYVMALKEDGTMVINGSDRPADVPSNLPYVLSLGSDPQEEACGVVTDPTRAGTPPSNVYITPPAQNLIAGTNAYFAASAMGSGTLNYQWYFNSTSIAGATRNTLTLRNLSVTNSGEYTVLVFNGAGSVTSAPALLNVILALDISTTPTLTLKGTVGSQVGIDYLDMLGSGWARLATVTLTNNEQIYFDLTARTNGMRYYRLVAIP